MGCKKKKKSIVKDKKKSRKLDRERRHRMEDSRSSGDDNSRDMIPPPLTAKEDSGSDGDSPPSRPILMDVPVKDEIKDNVLTGKDDTKAVTKKEVDEEEDGEAGSGKADGELEGDTGEDEDGEGLIKLKPPRPPRKKVKETRDSPLYEEDIVEGFSFAAFETYDDLEKMAKWSSQNSGKFPDPWAKLKF